MTLVELVEKSKWKFQNIVQVYFHTQTLIFWNIYTDIRNNLLAVAIV